MIVLVGLGNPGNKYEPTRHNIGFRVLDNLAIKLATEPWQNREKYAQALTSDGQVLLIKPQEFMNQSGPALVQALHQRPIEAENLWVIHDDADLPFGQIKIKRGGTSAGHHGIESIDQTLPCDYWRIRFGVGRGKGELDEYVLSPFSGEEAERLEGIIDQLTEKLVEYIQQGITSETLNL